MLIHTCVELQFEIVKQRDSQTKIIDKDADSKQIQIKADFLVSDFIIELTDKNNLNQKQFVKFYIDYLKSIPFTWIIIEDYFFQFFQKFISQINVK